MVYKQFPSIRGELQGGVLEGLEVIFAEFSDKFSDEFSVKNPYVGLNPGGFQTCPSGSREEISCRIRICGQK